MESFDQCGDRRWPLQFVDGDIAGSPGSKREDRQGGGRTWRRDQERGQKSRDKVIRIDGLSEEDMRRRLL